MNSWQIGNPEWIESAAKKGMDLRAKALAVMKGRCGEQSHQIIATVFFDG